jgi:hypothetical protein
MVRIAALSMEPVEPHGARPKPIFGTPLQHQLLALRSRRTNNSLPPESSGKLKFTLAPTTWLPSATAPINDPARRRNGLPL